MVEIGKGKNWFEMQEGAPRPVSIPTGQPNFDRKKWAVFGPVPSKGTENWWGGTTQTNNTGSLQKNLGVSRKSDPKKNKDPINGVSGNKRAGKRTGGRPVGVDRVTLRPWEKSPRPNSCDGKNGKKR